MKTRKPLFSVNGVTMCSGALLLMLGASEAAYAVDDLVEAFQAGKPLVDIRTRYETVDQEGISERAHAYTARARLGYETGSWKDFSVLGEIEAIQHIGSERFNDGVNNRTRYPSVGDPEDTALNRLSVSYTGIENTKITVGRQRVIFDNQRWFGQSNWRQNDNTHDAVALRYAAGDLALDYVYSMHMNRSGGNDSPIGEYHGQIHILHGEYKLDPLLSVTPYAYLWDLDRYARNASAQTYGVRLSGAYPLPMDGWKLTYVAEGARQMDYGDSPRDFNEGYFWLEPGVAYGKSGIRVIYESLGGNGVDAIQVPMATLHAHNGWADKFTTIPANGLNDLYLDVTFVPEKVELLKNTKFFAQLHDYASERGTIDYGHEWGAGVEQTFAQKYTLGVKYADYTADQFATDTNKFWVYLQYVY